MSTLKDKPLKKCHTDSRKMIDDIHSEIIKDMNEEELCEYYLENGLLLNEYYSNNEEVQKVQKLDKGILNFFKDAETQDDNTNVNSRKDILNKYLSNVDDKVLDNRFIDKKIDKCNQCNNKLSYDEIEGLLICNKCGYSEIIVINEWWAQFQAKGTTEVPDTIYRDVYEELDKDINRNISSINPITVRNILKRLNYNKYYEHIPHLINVLTGKDPPTLSRKSEELLRSLFKEIQVPFMNNCPKNRKNFLSYSYVLHKFCELLEFDHLLPFFPFLKSREKLIQQDIIWEKICKELKWEYIPST